MAVSSKGSFRLAVLCAAGFAILSLAGCGVGSIAPSAAPVVSIHGIVHGGPNPIKGGHVILWQSVTGSPGKYGSTALQLATATTDGYGSFGFNNTGSGAYTCATGEYAYITVTGGYTGANTPNPNSVQMAAIGSCSHLQSIANQNKTEVFLSEVSTVAAAYALGNFININKNANAGAGLQLVSVGAPAANNAATPACTGSGKALACTANGLGHAFANAANLVDAVHFDGTFPTGLARTSPPSNSQASVPQALINTLGNIQQACVNTVGGKANDGSACGMLFNNSRAYGLVAPTDTLQAMINIAQSPNNNVTTLFDLSTPTAFFNPALTTAPEDLSLAIAYSGTSISGTSTAFLYPYSVALDYNDNAYVLYSNTASASYAAVAGLTANGSSIFATLPNATYTSPITLATDLLGHVWVTNNGSATARQVLIGLNTADGSVYQIKTVSQPPYAIAVDKNNNLWFTSAITGQQDLFELSASNNYANVTFPNPPVQTTGNGPQSIAIDGQQNVWVADFLPSSGTGAAAVFPNSGTVAAPAYAKPIITTSLASGDYLTYGIAVDSTGDAYVASHQTLSEVTPSPSSANVTSIASTDIVSTSPYVPRFIELDGAGTVWASALTNVGSTAYVLAGSGVAVKLHPCYAASGSQTCVTGNSQDNRTVQVDSTGSVWEAASGDGHVLQIIGTAAPTWPQLSLGLPGAMPK